MISALRAGASEFLSSPIKPSIYEAMDRIGALLESRRSAMMERGTIAGVLSAKGGCGATSFACHLGAALHLAANARAGAPPRVLIADLDYQTPGASGVFRNDPRTHAGEAFDAVRRLSSSVWRDFVTSIPNGVDLLASPADVSTNPPAVPPEQWRVESLFRFVGRQYRWILVDLGRHLNPANWTLLQNVEELFVVTAPDVLALYQTRTILQTLSNRGFDKARIKIILNKNLSSPQDFWVESIEQMFEMSVFGVIPDDRANLEKLPRDRFEFPAESPFGRAIAKIAARMVRPPGTGSSRKAA
jgi:pilus assembly protein CpaE